MWFLRGEGRGMRAWAYVRGRTGDAPRRKPERPGSSKVRGSDDRDVPARTGAVSSKSDGEGRRKEQKEKGCWNWKRSS